MAFSGKDVGRQWELTAVAEFDYTDADGETLELVDIPAGARVTGGYVVIVNAWDTGTTAVLDLGDKTTGDRYVSNLDAKTPGGTAIVPAGPAFTVKDAVTVNITNTGTAPEAGDGYVVVKYVIDGRSNENGV